MEAIKNNIAISNVEISPVGIDVRKISTCTLCKRDHRQNWISLTKIVAVKNTIDVFAIRNGHVTVPNDICPLEVLFSTLYSVSSTFGLDTCPGLDLNCRATLHRILQSIFDTNTQDFLERETSEIFAHLSSKQKARILAQAIATFTIIFQRLAQTGQIVTYGLLNREAQLFAESDQRALMQDAIEESRVFEDCEKKSDIADAILEAMDAEEAASTPQPVAMDDKFDYAFSPGAALEHSKKMGLSLGFSVMAIN